MLWRLLIVLFLIVPKAAFASGTLDIDRVHELFQSPNRLVMFWSVECPPCYDELAMVEGLLAQYPELPITLVSTDDMVLHREEINSIYNTLKGAQLQMWTFAEGRADSLRYAIDPQWSGELPRSYYVDTEGQKRGHSGVITSENILTLFPNRR